MQEKHDLSKQTNSPKSSRPDWDSFFLEQAKTFATRGTCNRLQVGCIITRDNLQLAEGFNGSISGHAHCTDEGCLLNDEGRCIRTIHAEQNALLNAMKKGVSVQGGTAYVTHEPCETCTKLLNQAGIKRVVFLKPYNNPYNQHFQQGMEMVHHQVTEKENHLQSETTLEQDTIAGETLTKQKIKEKVASIVALISRNLKVNKEVAQNIFFNAHNLVGIEVKTVDLSTKSAEQIATEIIRAFKGTQA